MQYVDVSTNITVRVVSNLKNLKKLSYFKKVWYLENSKCICIDTWACPQISKSDKWIIIRSHGKTIIYYQRDAITEDGYYEINTGIESWDKLLNHAVNFVWDIINCDNNNVSS